MPHVEISHFPADLSDAARQRLDAAVTAAVTEAFGVPEGAVSIGLEGVDKAEWQERVYRPLITERSASALL
ncbi:tautomerase family protein, partial [Streptomyces roseolus]|uniref:tautomerase family protein n=1 Tax=Streptomyces roseolus TaxID=67358 RepID=UPI0036663323